MIGNGMPFQYYELFSKRFGFTLKKSRNISFGKMALKSKLLAKRRKTHIAVVKFRFIKISN